MENGLLKFITCGSVDDGKSTLIGHILYDAKLLYTDQEKALQLDSKVGSRGGAIDYSLLLDGLMAEREQGITIDVAYRYFTTEKRSFIVADTPGHEEYTRNMAVGASFADLAIILVDASQGVLVQTRRHARICALMGIQHFVIAINKMDLVGYDHNVFDQIQLQVDELAQKLGLSEVVVIPVSATEGDNVTRRSDKMDWYQGPVLLSYLEEVDINETGEEQGFYLPVQRVCRPNHEFRGFQGQIEAGQIHVGDELTTLPSKEQAHVKKILVGDKESNQAVKGQPVTIQLDREVDVSRGCVLTVDAGLKLSRNLTATLLWMDDDTLFPGKNFLVKLGSKLIPGVLTQIHYSIDVNNGESKKTNMLSKNEIAVCSLVLSENIVVDEFKKHKTLGECILIDRITNVTSACGVINYVKESDASDKKRPLDGTARALLKGQKATVIEFPLSGPNAVTEEFLAKVERRLTETGRATYLYLPETKEFYAKTVRHLVDAGLVVLLGLDLHTGKDNVLRNESYYHIWQKENDIEQAVLDIRNWSAMTEYGLDITDYII